MMKTGSDILFQEPTSATRRLRRSTVVDASADRFSIQFVAEPFEFELDQEVLMYFNGRREFLQQVGRIVEVNEADPETGEPKTYGIEPVGDPISAENRQNYRVSTISAGLEATVGAESNLAVQDLSATGFAVLASESYQIGQTIDVRIAHGDEICTGTAAIQSVREFGPGRIRYGLRAIEQDPTANEFLEVLQRISLAVQREQLQRSGAANGE